MTIDRAIEILDPEHRENYDGMDEVNEACRMGMEALERTRWIPCSERLPEGRGGIGCTVVISQSPTGCPFPNRRRRNKMRLIDADELKGKAIADPDDGEYFVYCQDIDEAPTVDAVPVVRFQEREEAVAQLRKKWQAAEMFICTMCGHFDHSIDGNIVYGNKDCGEIVGYPCCKKFTPRMPLPELLEVLP